MKENNFFKENRTLTKEEAKKHLEIMLGESLIKLISMDKSGRFAKVIVNTERGVKEIKISLPYVPKYGFTLS